MKREKQDIPLTSILVQSSPQHRSTRTQTGNPLNPCVQPTPTDTKENNKRFNESGDSLFCIEEELIAEINTEIGLTETRFVISRRIWAFISTPLSFIVTVLSAIIASPNASSSAAQIWGNRLIPILTIVVFCLSAFSTVIRPSHKWANAHRGVIEIRAVGMGFDEFNVSRRSACILYPESTLIPQAQIVSYGRPHIDHDYASTQPAPQTNTARVSIEPRLSRQRSRIGNVSLLRTHSFRLPTTGSRFPISSRINFLRKMQSRIREIEKTRGSYGMGLADVCFMCSVRCCCIQSRDISRLQWKRDL